MDEPLYRHRESYSSSGYTLDALTAAAQEAANDYSWELSSTSSPVRPGSGRATSEDLPPLVSLVSATYVYVLISSCQTPDAIGIRETPRSDAESLPPTSYVPPCIWEVIDVEDKLAKASVMRSTSLSLEDREDDDETHSIYSASVPNALGHYGGSSWPARPHHYSHRREESTATVFEADASHLLVQFRNSMLGSPDGFRELKPRSLGQPSLLA